LIFQPKNSLTLILYLSQSFIRSLDHSAVENVIFHFFRAINTTISEANKDILSVVSSITCSP